VELVGLDALGEDVQPVQLGRPPRRDRGRPLKLPVGDLLGRAGRVVLGAHGDLERAQELLALRDRLRVRDHLFQRVERRAREREQAVVDTDDRLADEVEPVAQEEVVGLVDAAGLGVVHRNKTEAGPPDLDRLEHRPDRRKRAVLGFREELDRALFRVGARLPLIGDDHRQ
jgi:hypothetical protein